MAIISFLYIGRFIILCDADMTGPTTLILTLALVPHLSLIVFGICDDDSPPPKLNSAALDVVVNSRVT